MIRRHAILIPRGMYPGNLFYPSHVVGPGFDMYASTRVANDFCVVMVINQDHTSAEQRLKQFQQSRERK